MLKALNHSVHAQEDLNKRLKTTGPIPMPLSKQAISDVCRLLDCAVSFELPTKGIVMDWRKSLEILDPSELQLPFPVVALEYCSPEIEPTPDLVSAKKRIALCLDYAANKNSFIASQAAKALPAITTVGGIIVVPCYYSDKAGSWVMVSWASILLKDNVIGVRPLCLDLGGGKFLSSKLNISSFPCLPELVEIMLCHQDVSLVMRNAILDSWDEVMAVITMITALCCTNVMVEDHAPSPTLNKKRRKKGKKPFRGHKKIIVISPGRQSRLNGDTNATTGRTLRTHLRRGHVRCLSDGHRIWVESCVVNADRGSAENRYRVKPAFLAPRLAA